MKWKQFLNTGFVTIGCLALFTGCSNSTTTMPADLSYTETDMSFLTVSADNRQGSVASFHATPCVYKRAGQKDIHSRLLPAYT